MNIDVSRLSWPVVAVVVAVLAGVVALTALGQSVSDMVIVIGIVTTLLLQLLNIAHSAEVKNATKSIAEDLNGKLHDTLKSAVSAAINERSIVEEPFRPKPKPAKP